MRVLLSLLPIALAILVQGSSAQRPTTCPCGWTNSGRIVGGAETGKKEIPWMAALFNTRTNFVGCGADIITRRHALTAAHCYPVLKDNPGLIVLLVGAHDIRDTRDAFKVPIQKLIMHPAFDKRSHYSDDIAVVVTQTPIPFSATIGPVCLPTAPVNVENLRLRGIGWGKEGINKPPSPVLKNANITVVTRSTCLKYWKLAEPSSQLCVMEKLEGPCTGDSGGSWVLIDPETRRYTLMGITSFGKDCTIPPPAVLTEIGAYFTWIKQTIQANQPENICTRS